MENKVLRIIQASMLVVGVSVLGGCFERQYYGGPGYGYAPGYAYTPEYAAPYRYGPAYYPRSYSYQPEYRPAYRYDGGGRGWGAHEHEEHEEHEHHEHHRH